jgi:hypothetical protein
MTPIDITEIQHRSLKKIVFAWESGASGGASGITDKVYTGTISRVMLTHDAVSPPQAAYDVKITNDSGFDLICNMGKDIAPVEDKTLSSGMCTMGAVTEEKILIEVSGAGAAGKKGIVTVFLR